MTKPLLRFEKYTKKVHKTPRILLADAYTIGANQFQSKQAKEKSVYYITFRRILNKINPELYAVGDNRMLLFGIQRIIERILMDPVEQWEISDAKEFLKKGRITTEGFKEYWFPEALWQRVIDEFGGYPPIKITAMPEGSVVYPNEPCVMIESLVDGFGELAAWFESKLLQIWAASERGTQDRHFYDAVRKLYRKNFPHLSEKEINFYASIVLTDFGDRAGICSMESEDLGMTGLYTFSGTDTFCGAYQAFKNTKGDTTGIYSSVYALAHRNVQAYQKESGAYDALYEAMENGDYGSMVNDCYASRNAVKKYHVELAIRSIAEGNGKIIVTRPDSGVAKDEVLFTIKTAIEAGLSDKVTFEGSGEWIIGTALHFIEGDGLTHHDILEMLQMLIDMRFVPWTWGLFGMGGGQRNGLKRDNLSAKYALCAMGNDNQGVVKFSDTFGKTTLPGPFKVLRSKKALDEKKTVVFLNEEGENAMVVFYNGLSEHNIFDGGMLDDFLEIKERSHIQFDTMPLTLSSENNHNYPASDAIIAERKRLLELYAPDKDANNY